MKRIGPEALRALIPCLDSEEFVSELYDHAGIFVIRKAIPFDAIRLWQEEWGRFYAAKLTSRTADRFNPVAIYEEPPPVLAAVHRHPSLVDIAEKAFGPDVALFNQRFVIKDWQSRGPVFLHHDFAYHMGWPAKASAFVPLSEVTAENGALRFYPGTHHFGYLGDAGEIDPEIIGPDWPSVRPDLRPGDVAFMNSLTWHESGPHTAGPDRVMVDITYQPANDPSGIALLRGQWQTEIFLDRQASRFRRSRASRMREMQQRLDELESTARV
jgi:hypothetical protein